MKNRRTLAIVVTVCLILSMFPMTNFAQTDDIVVGDQASFPDTVGHWASNQITKWSNLGLVQGDESGFRPDDSLTRAEMAVILDNLMDYQTKSINSFRDVPSTAWYADAVLKANAAGILLGYGAGHASPSDNITREQAAVMLARAFAVEDSMGNNTAFSDAENISSWAKKQVYGMETYKYIGGMGDGTFAPKADVTRAQVVTMIDNAVKAYYTEAGTYTEDVASDITGANCVAIVKVPNVIIKDAKISGDLIVAEGVGNGDFTLDGTEVTGTMIARGGGDNSIIITGGSDVQNIRIEKIDGQIRVVSEEGSVIGTVIIDGNDDVIIQGEIGTVIVMAEGVNVYATDATITSVFMTGANSNLIVGNNSTVNSVTVSGAGVSISGSGEVGTVSANANNVSVTTFETVVTAAVGTTGVIAGTTPVLGGTSETVIEEVVSGGGGGTSQAGPNEEQSAPTGLAGVAPTSYGLSDGSITGTTTLMEYKLSSGVSYTGVTGTSITGLAAGTYNVRYAAKTGYNAGTDAAVVVAEGPLTVSNSADLVAAGIDAAVSTIVLDGNIILAATLVLNNNAKTVDLNGKSLTAGTGIVITASNSTIKNGTIAGATIVSGFGTEGAFQDVVFIAGLTNVETGRNYTNCTFAAITNTTGNSTYTGSISGAVTNTAGDSTYTAGNIGGAVTHSAGTASYNVDSVTGALTVTTGTATFSCAVEDIVGAITKGLNATLTFNGVPY